MIKFDEIVGYISLYRKWYKIDIYVEKTDSLNFISKIYIYMSCIENKNRKIYHLINKTWLG